jgi:hypothetical protein
MGGISHYSAVDCWCCSFHTPLVGSEGRLRISRGADNPVRTYLWTLGGWELAGTSTQDTADMRLGFSAYTFRGFFQGTQFALDNFSIQADGLSIPVTPPIPEPSTWVLMVLGIGVLATRARQRLFMPKTNGLAGSSSWVTLPLSEKMRFSTFNSCSPRPLLKSSLP